MSASEHAVEEAETFAELSKTLRPLLEEVARRGETITYRDLAIKAKVASPHTIHKTTHALETLIHADHAAGRPLLGALAVSKTGRPQVGFFQLLHELGRYDGPERGAEADAQHDRELAEVYAAYRG